MRFALICRDKPGALPLRTENRAAHLAYLQSSNVVEMAGPFLDDQGQMVGSLLIVEVPDKTAAQAWAEADPYARAGLFESVTVQAWKKVIG